MRSGRPGVTRLRILLDIETGQAHRAAGQEQESEEFTAALQLVESGRPKGTGHELQAPCVRKDGGRNAKADDVGQRIQLTAKIAGGICHAGDPAIEAIEHHSKTNGLRSNLKTLRCQRRVRSENAYCRDRANDGKVA